MLLIILILTIPMALADDRLDICESLLFKQDQDLKAAEKEIESLYLEIDRLLQDKVSLQMENEILRYQEKEHKGLYIGGGGGVSLNKNILLEATLMYKFNRSVLYLSGGYMTVPYIQLGFLQKINTGR